MSLGGYLPPVVAEILAQNGEFKAAMSETKAELTGLQAATSKLAAVGKVAMAGLAIGVAAVAFESVKLAASFDQTMELIHTQDQAAQSTVEALKGKVLDLAGAVGQSPGSLAEALYHIASVLGPAVMDTVQGQAQAMDILTQAAKLASLGMANLDDVTYALSGVMSVGMKDIHNATDAVAMMNATVGMGDMRMQDLAAAIGTGILPAFKTAGLSFNDFAASIATLTDNSVPANEAATRLRMTVALLTAPSGEAAKALEDIGLSQIDAANALTARDAELAQFGITVSQLASDMQQPNGLLVAVKDLKSHLEGLSAPAAAAVIEKAFGGGKTSGAIQTLLEESDRLQSKYDQLGTSADRAKKFEDAWADQRKQFSQQWNELKDRVEAYGIKLGNWLIPKIQTAITWMSQHKDIVKILAIVIGTVLVVAIIAYTAAMMSAAIATLAATWPILAIIAVIALVAIGIYELVKHWDTAWNWIKQISGDVWHWIYQYIWKDGIWKAFDVTRDTLDQLVDWWKKGWDKIGEDIQNVYDHTIKPVLDAIGKGTQAIHDFFDTSAHGTTAGIPGRAGGGPVNAGMPYMVGENGPELYVPGQSGTILTPGQIAAMGRSSGSSGGGGGPSGGTGGGGGGGDQVIHQHIYLDSKQIWEGQLSLARNKSLTPAQMWPSTARAI